MSLGVTFEVKVSITHLVHPSYKLTQASASLYINEE